MAVKIKTAQGVHDVLAKMNKGAEKSAVLASSISEEDFVRMPTGIFALDYATGGGLAKGKINMFWGQESCGKSNSAYTAMGTNQILEPNGYQVLIDLEKSFDPAWAKHYIPDPDRLIVVTALSAEDAINKTEALIMAKEVSMLCVDSLAMLVPENELESGADKASVGGASALIGKMMRKMTARMSERSLVNESPTVICINQMRYKVGVMFGNPESMPGGMAPKHMSSLSLKFYGKDVLNEDETAPMWKDITVTLNKRKIMTLAHKCEFKMCMTPTEEGHQIGEVDDWKLLQNLLRNYGFLVQPGKGWQLLGDETFGTLEEVREYLRQNRARRVAVQSAVIEKAKADRYGASA